MSTPLVLVNSHQPSLYSLALAISHQKSNFNGTLTIDLVRDSTKTSPSKNDFEFQLHSSELIITSAIFEDGETELRAKVAYDRANEIAKLSVTDASLYKADSLFLTMTYIGKINTIKTFRDFTKGIFKTNYLDDKSNISSNYIVATHCQTSFARTIFPSIDEPSSKAHFKLTLSTDEKFKVISNTPPESKKTDGSTQTITFKETPAMNTSIFGFVIGDLDFLEAKVKLANKEIPIRFFSAIGSIQGAGYALDIAQKTLPFVERQFGSDYPLDKLDFVALPFLSDGAMENFGLVTIQSNYILSESLTNGQQTQSIRQLVVHQIIHHWMGNNVSFDEWSHLWLNESFATWFAYYVLRKLDLDPADTKIWETQVDEDFETILSHDGLVQAKPIVNNESKNVKSTQEAFQVHSYQKGIHFLRMLANTFENEDFNDELSGFVQALHKFIKKYASKIVKPTDLWAFLNDESKLDLKSFTHTWLRIPGFPILTVTINDQDKIVIEQHRYLENTTIEESQVEDVPYHVPLAIRLSDGSVVNKILNDRRSVLEEIKVEEFVKLNANRSGFYRVDYRHTRIFNNIIANFDKLSKSDLIGLNHDLSKIIGHEGLQSNEAVTGFLKISEKLITAQELDFTLLSHSLNTLRAIENSYKLFAANEDYNNFLNWLTKLNHQLFTKLDWSKGYNSCSPSELETRRSVLTIGINDKDIIKTSETLFKNLLHGPSRSVPVPLLEPALAATALNANQTNWKKILELVKQPGATTNNTIGGSGSEIQHAAISAIGYTKDPTLVKRVLNFVTTNIDSTMVELALVGLQFHHEQNKEVIWDWFKLHYNQWVARSLRPGSEYSANLKKTVNSISLTIFSCLINEKEQMQLNEFINDRKAKLPKHDLEANVEIAQQSQAEQRKIAFSIEHVVKECPVKLYIS